MLVIKAELLGVVGGLVGVVVSAVVRIGVTYWLLDDIWVTFQLQTLGDLLLAFVVGIGMSLVSGTYPARKAANEHPADMLRD